MSKVYEVHFCGRQQLSENLFQPVNFNKLSLNRNNSPHSQIQQFVINLWTVVQITGRCCEETSTFLPLKRAADF